MMTSAQAYERLAVFGPQLSPRDLVIRAMAFSTTGVFALDGYQKLCALVLDSDQLANEQIEGLIAGEILIVDNKADVSLGPSMQHLVGRRNLLMQSGAAHWDGEFSVYVADAEMSDLDQHNIGRTLRQARYGRLQPGCWMRPSNIAAPFDSEDAPIPGDLHAMRARLPHPRSLVSRLWDLDSWRTEASELAEIQEAAATILKDTGLEAVRLGCLTMFMGARILMSDPLLPPALVPSGWPSATLHSSLNRIARTTRELLVEGLHMSDENLGLDR